MLTCRSVKPRYTTAQHSTTRRFSNSPTDGNILDDDLIRSLLLLSTCFWRLAGISYSVSAPTRPTRRRQFERLQGAWQVPVAVSTTNGGSSRWDMSSCVRFANIPLYHGSLSPRRTLFLSTGYEPALFLLYHHYPCLRSRPLPAFCSPRRRRRMYPPEAQIVATSAPSTLTATLAPRPLSPCASWMTPDLITLSPSHHPHKDHRSHPYHPLRSRSCTDTSVSSAFVSRLSTWLTMRRCGGRNTKFAILGFLIAL